MTTMELAMFLGCSRQTIHSYIDKGMPKIQPKPNHTLRFDREAVLGWLKRGQAE